MAQGGWTGQPRSHGHEVAGPGLKSRPPGFPAGAHLLTAQVYSGAAQQASPGADQVLGRTAQSESVQVKLVLRLCGQLEPEARPLHGRLHTGVR